MCYYDLVASYFKNPRDVHTVPISQDKTPIWFYTFVDNRSLYVTSARFHQPSSRIKIPRRLNPREFDTMLNIYHRRQKGKSVSQEAKRITENQVYWYGLFSDMLL